MSWEHEVVDSRLSSLISKKEGEQLVISEIIYKDVNKKDKIMRNLWQISPDGSSQITWSLVLLDLQYWTVYSCIKKNSLMKEEENKLRDNYKASNNFARASDTKRSNKDSSQKLIESHHQDKNSRIDVIHKETRLFKRIGTKPSIAAYSSCIGP